MAPPPSENEILDQGLGVLKASLPPSWRVERLNQNGVDRDLGDAVFFLGTQQSTVRVVVEVKRSFGPKDVAAVARDARLLNQVAGDVRILLIAPWLSERSRSELTQAGINYLDLTGQLRFVSEYPAIFLLRSGVSEPSKMRQSIPSVKGVKAGRIVRFLTDSRPPYGVLEVAKGSQVTAGYASRFLKALEQDDIIQRRGRGSIENVNWHELLRRRAEVYDVYKTNRVETFVSPNGPSYALEVARDLGLPEIVLSGSFAAEQIVSVAPAAQLFLYARRRPNGLIERAGLLPAGSGANVVIAEPYDSVVMERRFDITAPLSPRVPLAAVSQIALDCLTGNGRMPQEGEALMAWMGDNEARWRVPPTASPSVSAA